MKPYCTVNFAGVEIEYNFNDNPYEEYTWKYQMHELMEKIVWESMSKVSFKPLMEA